jgi:hypothetical protein
LQPFDDHCKTDAAVHKLIDGGFDMKNFSVIGSGYHTEAKIVGFYNVGDRMKLCSKYGAFWVVSGVFFSAGYFWHFRSLDRSYSAISPLW